MAWRSKSSSSEPDSLQFSANSTSLTDNARQTGANTGDLGAPRRWGGGGGGEDHKPSSRALEAPPDPNAPRKRRSRWGDESTKSDLAGLPVAISSNVQGAELDNYATTLRLEEINRKLRTGDVVPNERERSVSPPPQYDSHGRRTNTRDIRYRKKLEEERVKLIEKAMKNDPNFRAPAEFMHFRKGRPQEKVYIPVKEFPEINFFGLLVGPRGNSLKKMERESGAKISIRGKGSVKDGKVRPDMYAGDEDEDLHAHVVADSEEKVRKCVQLINQVIETAASTPEGDNDHKRNQLRELAQLNGTLRDDEGQACQNCGKMGHRKWDCPEQRNFTANVICRICGGAGHMARDCMRRNQQSGEGGMSNGGGGGGTNNAQFDSEYASLMAELGEAPKESAQHNVTTRFAGNLPPWRNPDNWPQPQVPQERQPRPQYQNPYEGRPSWQTAYQQPQQNYQAAY